MPVDYGGYIRLWEGDCALAMLGNYGSLGSHYGLWHKWNLPSLAGLEHPRSLPSRAWYGYRVRGAKFEGGHSLGYVLWTNSDVSWTAASSISTLMAIFGDDGLSDAHVVRKAKRIFSETNIFIETSSDLPAVDVDFHFYDITKRVQQIYLANSLGACQMTTRHSLLAVDGSFVGDSSATALTTPGSDTLVWLQHVTKPASTKLVDGIAHSWDAYSASDDLGIWLFWDAKKQINRGIGIDQCVG